MEKKMKEHMEIILAPQIGANKFWKIRALIST